MFKFGTDLVEKHLPGGHYPDWVPIVIIIFIAWVIFMIIREFWCWFWKTSAISDSLSSIYKELEGLHQVSRKCQQELEIANSRLERIAESASAAAKQAAGSKSN